MTSLPVHGCVGGAGATIPGPAHLERRVCSPRDVFLANTICNIAQAMADSPVHDPVHVKALRGVAHDLLNVQLEAA